MSETYIHQLDGSDDDFIEEVGTCSMTGYPLLAIHGADGTHAGLALASVGETVRSKTRDDDGNAVPRVRVEDMATREEILRSWSELLLYALHERALDNPQALDRDAERCREFLATAHHYDRHRIIAAAHLSAVEHLRMHHLWSVPALALIPDVGEQNTAITAQLAVRRLARTDNEIPTTLDRLRHRYHQRLQAGTD